MTPRRKSNPLLDALSVLFGLGLIVGAIALVVAFPWLILVALASPLVLRVR